ncbi:MAG: carbamoyltransferase HypF [Dehalococcoidia bacterium]
MRIKGEEMVRARIVVQGVVQGVGFRPFIHRLAGENHLKGWVLNSTEGVVIEVEGDEERIEGFIADIVAEPPPLAFIERVDRELLPPVGYTSFLIRESARVEGRFALVSPDISICQDCLRELFDPQDRRYRYPFINCTNCGPRFTIIEDIPYDRPMTTMRVFPMCPYCEAEYNDPADRRFHAQPNACPECGPKVWLQIGDCGLQIADCNPQSDEPIEAARELLAAGYIVAVKGLGGFHLACDATNDAAVRTLRERKQRVDKPFAIMSYDAAAVERYCYLSQAERRLLESRKRPIVLLRRRPDSPISELVAPNNNDLGVMLPYTPLHYLLLSPQWSDGSPFRPLALVMTSGNMKEEPIATGNEEALKRLAPLADYFLLHDREIHIRCDDSVTRVFEGQEMPIRRSRGYAPFPIRVPFELEEILACGAELKNTFCLTKEGYAFLSQHIGDMENFETLASYEASIEHFKRLFRIEPRVIAYDMHPDYLATKYAQSQIADCKLQIAVQHHHAHIASCMAEHGLKERVIGVAFDGTGYGADGRIWGGEFLVADYRGFERAGHLAYVPMPGGEAAIKRPYRMALSHLHRAYGSLRAEPQGEALDLDLPLLRRVNPVELRVIEHQIERGLNSPLTSSMGRLFDAVSALIGVRDVINYEAQAAIELEMIAAEDVEEGYTLRAERSAERSRRSPQGEAIPLSPTPYPLVLDPAPLIRAIVADMEGGVDGSVISAKFHNAIAAMVLAVCGIIREQEGLNKVVLSGGVFQNVYLLRRSLHLLRGAGFEVYIHRLVPCNDGGISLGQALVANAQVKGN